MGIQNRMSEPFEIAQSLLQATLFNFAIKYVTRIINTGTANILINKTAYADDVNIMG